MEELKIVMSNWNCFRSMPEELANMNQRGLKIDTSNLICITDEAIWLLK